MKFEIEECGSGFQPIHMHITIESEAELRGWWHRLNIGPNQVTSRYRHSEGRNMPFASNGFDATTLWRAIDHIRCERGLCK